MLRDNRSDKTTKGVNFVNPLKDKNFKNATKRISDLATELYELMDNGTTIDFTFDEKKLPAETDERRNPNRLIVTRPAVHFEIAKKDERKPSQ